MLSTRTRLFFRCGIAGLLGGFLLLFDRSLNMQGQGLGLIAVGIFCFVIWYFGIGSFDRNKPRKSAPGPTFEVDDPEAANLAPTAAHLVRAIRKPRDSGNPSDGPSSERTTT